MKVNSRDADVSARNPEPSQVLRGNLVNNQTRAEFWFVDEHWTRSKCKWCVYMITIRCITLKQCPHIGWVLLVRWLKTQIWDTDTVVRNISWTLTVCKCYLDTVGFVNRTLFSLQFKFQRVLNTGRRNTKQTDVVWVDVLLMSSCWIHFCCYFPTEPCVVCII